MLFGEHFKESEKQPGKANIEIPEIQLELGRGCVRVNPNVAVVLLTVVPGSSKGQPASGESHSEVWLPGTEGGHAIIDVDR